MHAVILAAGFGTRMGDLAAVPKALLPLGSGCVLDVVVNAVWTEGVSCIHIVHNDAVIEVLDASSAKKVRNDWPKRFREWKRSLRWEYEVDRLRPYIRLVNNGVQSEDGQGGSVWDLAAFLAKMPIEKINDGILVACCDNLYPRLRIDFDVSRSAITCRAVGDLEATVLQGNPSRVVLGEDGTVQRVDDDGEVETPWRFCGPCYIARDDIPFVKEFAALVATAGERPDSLGELFQAMVDDGRSVQGLRLRDVGRYRDVGTLAGYRFAQSLYHGAGGAAS